ncbi:MAG TPA: LamG domain-containing protein [Verrucomicrobiae bacterium]|nr:LamG domain-containing protein [Verrucomicrobiae bacterium]
MSRFFRLIAGLMLGGILTARLFAQDVSTNDALQFDGINNWAVYPPAPLALDPFPMTIMVWIKTTQNSPKAQGAIVNKYEESAADGYQLVMINGHVQGWYYGDNGDLVDGGPPDGGFVADGKWHHIAFTVDASGGYLYVDGALKSSRGWNGIPGGATINWPLKLGYYPDIPDPTVSGLYQGQLDEVSLWNANFYTRQVQAYMNHRLTGAEEHLVGYWPFNEGAGSVAVDATGHGYNMTLVENPLWVPSNPAIGQPGLGPLPQTWRKSTAGNDQWYSLAGSADGRNLTVASSSGAAAVSSNGGLSWQNSSFNTGWSSMAASGDGAREVAGTYGGSMLLSTNYGLDWTISSSPALLWYSVASSDDGQQLVGAPYGGPIYISTNAGSSWQPAGAPSTNWFCVVSSSDGVHLAAAVFGGPIYTSADAGVTWAPTSSPSDQWHALSCSADGSKLVAAIRYGDVYYSTNYGVDWMPSATPPDSSWTGLACSADGSCVALGGQQGVYTSTNYGADWTQAPLFDAQNWSAVSMSADGSAMTAGSFMGPVFTTTAPPSLSVAGAGANLQLSWPAYPGGFNLEGSSDFSAWTGITNEAALTDGTHTVTLPPDGSQQFFRLQTP